MAKGTTMKSSGPNDARLPGSASHGSRQLWIIGIGCLLITFLAVFLPRPQVVSRDSAALTKATNVAIIERAARIPSTHRRSNPATESTTPKTAEEIVAGKLSQF